MTFLTHIRGIAQVLVVFASIVGLIGRCDAADGTSLPHLVIGPPGGGIRDLFNSPDSWTQARSHIQAILYPDHALGRLPDAELSRWFAMMRSWNISLELEVGAIKEWGPTADDTFGRQQPMWDRAIRLGANLHSIVMDEPLIASQRKLHRPDSYAIEQTARFVALVRQHFPRMLIGDVEPYPAISVKDQVIWVRALQQRLQSMNVAPLDFYRVDVDWAAFARGAPGQLGRREEAGSRYPCRGPAFQLDLLGSRLAGRAAPGARQ